MDEGFDAPATLTIFEAREEEERLQATAVEIDLQTKAKEAAKFGRKARQEDKASNNAGKGQVPTECGGPSGSAGINADGDAWLGGKPAVVTRAEDKLMGFADAVLARGNSNDGQDEFSEGKMSEQEKQAEAVEETKAKATDSEQAED